MQLQASSPALAAAPLAALRDDGSLDPAHASGLTGELLVALYEHMVLARVLDERLVSLQREGRITQHSSALGEEATVIGAVAAMQDQDWVFPGPRDFAAALWRGVPLSAYMSHVFGNAGDAGKGRDAPGPPFWKAVHVASTSPLVGTHIPHAVGAAWAARIRGTGAATLVYFGEGATSSGDFHTGLNFAGVTRAPVIAVCKNNGMATSTPASKQTASASFAVKAVAYGLRGVRVDGADVVAIHSVVREARARAVAGEGGTLVEAVIPGNEPDPIARLRRHLDSRGLGGSERETRLLAEVNADVDRALADAAQGPKPARETLFEDVYAAPPWNLVEAAAHEHSHDNEDDGHR
jgi:pyruvate dehydrogenase E1 component alpha subunit